MRGYSRTKRVLDKDILKAELNEIYAPTFANRDLTNVNLQRSLSGIGMNFSTLEQKVNAERTLWGLQAELDCRKWRALNLMPVVDDIDDPEAVAIATRSNFGRKPPPLILVWKHVRRAMHGCWMGNLGAPYEIGTPYIRPSMTTAGPSGAIRDWSQGYGSEKYVMSIAGIVSTFNAERGIYYALYGIPRSVYHVPDSSEDEGMVMDLVDGNDTLQFIE